MLNTDNINKPAVFSAENSIAETFKAMGLDAAPGTALRELVIRPDAVIRSQEEDWRRSLLTSLDLNAIAAGSIEGEDDLLDAIASIYRIKRRTGGESAGTIVIQLNWNGSDVYVNSSVSFRIGGVSLEFDGVWIGNGSGTGTPRNGVNYTKIRRYPAEISTEGEVTYANEMLIPVRCPSGEEFAAGTEVAIVGPTGTMVAASVFSPIIGGGDVETNQELATRILQALPPGVMSTPLQLQNSIGTDFGRSPLRVAVIGGQEGSKRAIDKVTGLPLPGFVDVYTAAEGDCPVESIEGTAEPVSEVSWRLVIPPSKAAGLYEVRELYVDGEPVSDFIVTRSAGAHGTHILSDDTVAYTAFQTVTVTFPGTFEFPPTCLVTVSKQAGIDTIQAYCDSSEKRCPAQDTVVHAAPPVFLNVSLAVSNNGVDDETIRTTICNYVNSLPVGRGYISASDFEAALKPIGVSVVFPMSIRAKVIDENGDIHYMISNDGYLGVGKYTIGGVFYLSASDIQVVAR